MSGRILPPGIYSHTDLNPGDRIETAHATVAGAAIDRFAELSGDCFALHLSDDAARELGFPRRVAHGLLVLSLIDGLKNQSPAQLRAVASLGWDVRFRAPVLVEDSLQAVFTVASKKPARDGRRGIVVLSVQARNQDGIIVQEGSTTLMMLP